MDGRVSILGRSKTFPHRVQTGSGAHKTLVKWELGALSPGVKWPAREADQSPPCSAELKKGGAIPPLPRMSSWHSTYLIKHRHNFTFLMLWTPEIFYSIIRDSHHLKILNYELKVRYFFQITRHVCNAWWEVNKIISTECLYKVKVSLSLIN
jgi:hypothetical protein